MTRVLIVDATPSCLPHFEEWKWGRCSTQFRMRILVFIQTSCRLPPNPHFDLGEGRDGG
jgi:hypothetical protein